MHIIYRDILCLGVILVWYEKIWIIFSRNILIFIFISLQIMFCFRVVSDTNIIVTAVNQRNLSRDSYTVQPISRLGRVYRSASYYPSSLGTQLAVISISEGTTVVVEFPGGRGAWVTIRGQTYYDKAEISMRQYETLQIQARILEIYSCILRLFVKPF